MRFNELTWSAGDNPYSMSPPLTHTPTGWRFQAYVTEDGTYDLLGQNTDVLDKRDLSKLELASLLTDFEVYHE